MISRREHEDHSEVGELLQRVVARGCIAVRMAEAQVDRRSNAGSHCQSLRLHREVVAQVATGQ
jgi:hypothetical protein